jgi:hypothetical protein
MPYSHWLGVQPGGGVNLETELVSEKLVFDLALTRLYAQENFITLVHHGGDRASLRNIGF